jgi:predicted acetyltransferase
MYRLVEPSVQFKQAFLDMLEDYEKKGEDCLHKEMFEYFYCYEQYVNLLHRQAMGLDPATGYLPTQTFWLMKDREDTILGISRFSPWMTYYLFHEAGQIGYDVPPTQRRKGYGSLLLSLTLGKARSFGLRQVLLTCEAHNIASVRIIEKNGGILENQIISPFTGRKICRYWIPLDSRYSHLGQCSSM